MSLEQAPTPSKYTYHELSDGEIRLLSLHPGEFGSHISSSLKQSNIYEAPGNYEALSYVWGTSTNRMEINCDGAQLLVTTNLFQALQRLRSPSETRILWVDTVCTDQGNLEERNRQILLVEHIY
jgi:hypothetical protein